MNGVKIEIMKILIVKLSSLGDVLHTLPVIWDLRERYPLAQIDWAVEEAYVDLLKPFSTTPSFAGIDRVIPIAFRRWKKNLKRGEFVKSIQEYFRLKNNLQSTEYDLIIEVQGLLKAAWITHLANPRNKAKIFGLGNKTEFSGYESGVRFFYTDCVHVPVHCHSVDRSRWVVAAALDSSVPNRNSSPPKFYSEEYRKALIEDANLKLNNSLINLGFDASKPYALFFHSTAGLSKRWHEKNWIELAKKFSQRGIQVVFPWGNEAEKKISQLLAKDVQGAIVPHSFLIDDAFYLILGATIIVGVDTGLTHLSAILAKPTIELYCDSPRWKTEGYWSNKVINLGDKGSPPAVSEVLTAFERLKVI